MKIPLSVRLSRKLEVKPSGCIEFIGCRDRWGYGLINVSRGKNMSTHRAAWLLANGVIPEGMFVCHKCDNPPCCNIDHLWLGTLKENMADMSSKGRSSGQSKTHCKQGHPLSGENVYLSRKQRHCRVCGRDRDARFYQRKKATKI